VTLVNAGGFCFCFTLCGEELKAVAGDGVRARFPCVFLFVSTLDMRSRFVREREWPVRQTRVRSFIFLLLRKSFVNDWNSVQPSSVSQFPDDTDGRAKKKSSSKKILNDDSLSA
jgi:hypothetical protein